MLNNLSCVDYNCCDDVLNYFHLILFIGLDGFRCQRLFYGHIGVVEGLEKKKKLVVNRERSDGWVIGAIDGVLED